MEVKDLPAYLERSPLVEAIWEIRFNVNPALSIGDLLPGIVFVHLDAHSKGYVLNQLPFVQIPRDIIDTNENFKFQAKYRIESTKSPYLYHIGEHMVSLNCRKPYEGWGAFKNKIIELIGILKRAPFEFIEVKPSLRYINFLPQNVIPSLSPWLRIKLNIGDFLITMTPLQIRAELPETECTHTVQIVHPAQLVMHEADLENKGIIVDIDSVLNSTQHSLDDTVAQIEMLHAKNKEFFFNQILTEDAIEKFGPRYTEEAGI